MHVVYQLQDEVKQLRAELTAAQNVVTQYAEGERKLREQLAECERDAKRYRWVREHCELIEDLLFKADADKTGEGS